MREFEQGKFPTEVTLETRTFKTKGPVREWQKTHSHSMNIARITGEFFGARRMHIQGSEDSDANQ